MGVDEVIQAGLQAGIKCDWNKRNIYHVRMEGALLFRWPLPVVCKSVCLLV